MTRMIFAVSRRSHRHSDIGARRRAAYGTIAINRVAESVDAYGRVVTPAPRGDARMVGTTIARRTIADPGRAG